MVSRHWAEFPPFSAWHPRRERKWFFSMEKKKRSPIAMVLAVLYLLQVVLVSYWEYSPVENRDMAGIRHEVKKGFGFPWALLPGYGLLPVVMPKFLLIKTTLETEKKEKKSFTSLKSIYAENPEVWPEKQTPQP